MIHWLYITIPDVGPVHAGLCVAACAILGYVVSPDGLGLLWLGFSYWFFFKMSKAWLYG